MTFLSRRLFVPFLLFIATFIVSLNAWYAFRTINELLVSESWVEHTLQVMQQVEEMTSSATGAEYATRGYILTGDQSYLARYNEVLKKLPSDISQVQKATADNLNQQTRLAEFRSIMDGRLILLEHAIQLKKIGNQETPQALVISDAGKMEMDRLRLIANDIENEERRLLAVRSKNAQSSRMRTRFAVGLASVLDFLLIVFTFRYFVHERRLRIETEQVAANLARSEANLRQKGEELDALNTELERRVQTRTSELEAINRELEAFSYSVSHDLRAPLRTIDGFSLALEEDYTGVVDETGRDYIRRVRTGVQRMGQLIDALLQLSRITRSGVNNETFDISALASAVASVLAEQNPDREIKFDIESDLTAYGDPKLLQVALENLIGNAVKFTSRKEKAVITFGWDRDKNAYFIRDNGAGFDMAYSEKLFTAFNRLHGDKDFKGSGIGLATVSRIIHRHHGTIWAEAKVDHGATLWFTLG